MAYSKKKIPKISDKPGTPVPPGSPTPETKKPAVDFDSAKVKSTKKKLTPKGVDDDEQFDERELGGEG